MNNKIVLETLNSVLGLKDLDFNQYYLLNLKNDVTNLINYKNKINVLLLTGSGSSDIIDYKTSIFNGLYNSFQNILFPLNQMTNESQFIYCLFNKTNPFDLISSNTFPDIVFSITSQKNYRLSFNKNDINRKIYFIPMIIFYIVKLFVIQLFPINNVVQTLDWYLVPSSITNLSDLSSILSLIPYEINVTSFCIFNLITSMGFTTNLINTTLYPEQTLITLSLLHVNLIKKIMYSCVGSLLYSDLSPAYKNMCFFFNISSKSSNMIFLPTIPSLTKKCSFCDPVPMLNGYFVNPQVISYTYTVQPTDQKTINKSNAYWYNIFDFNPNVLVGNIYIQFKEDMLIYPIPDTTSSVTDYLDIFFELFYLRPDNFILLNSNLCILFKQNSIIYARPSSFLPINTLPGYIILNNSEEYILSLSKIYGIDKNYLNLYIKHSLTNYKVTLLDDILEIKSFIKQNKNRTINELVNILKVSSNLRKNQIMYLLGKHSKMQKLFINSPFKELDVYELNKYLFIYIFSLYTFKQDDVSYYLNETTLLNKIEEDCIIKFKSLTDKNLIYSTEPLCTCLYKSNDEISPYCFDQNCRVWLPNENSIFKDYKCIYPLCSQGVSFENIISPSTDLNYTLQKIKCAGYDFTKDLTSGNYNIYFILNNTKYIWVKQSNISVELNSNNLVLSNPKYIFNLTLNADTSITLNDIDIKNGLLINYKSKSTVCIQSLLDNTLYFISKQYNIPITCQIDVESILRCSFPTNSTNLLIKLVLVKLSST